MGFIWTLAREFAPLQILTAPCAAPQVPVPSLARNVPLTLCMNDWLGFNCGFAASHRNFCHNKTHADPGATQRVA
jgi:hypothetical protein